MRANAHSKGCWYEVVERVNGSRKVDKGDCKMSRGSS